jgi:O-methyltransferase
VHTTGATETVADLYLDLLARCLTRSGFGEKRRVLTAAAGSGPRATVTRLAAKALDAAGLELVKNVDATIRAEGRDVPSDAETMVGLRRLDNLRECIEDALAQNVPGDLIETGVWRGGAAIFMRAVLKANDVTDRTVWCADSFEGLPRPDAQLYPADADDPHWRVSNLAVSLEEVKANFEKFSLLDDQVRFLPGWFRDTLPVAPIERIAVLRLDGDMYESTMVGLRALYPKLSDGGWLIVDDYGAVESCRTAVEDYRRECGIVDTWQQVDWTGICWRKTSS